MVRKVARMGNSRRRWLGTRFSPRVVLPGAGLAAHRQVVDRLAVDALMSKAE
jgi:hypothetical protein